MAELSLLEQLSADLADVHARVARSLVQVRRGGRSIGAGSVWDAAGLILTNAHVVDGRGRVTGDLSVRLPGGRELPAAVRALDRGRDLALLEVQGMGLEPIAQGDARGLGAGALVMAFGFPFGLEGGATAGNVIALGAGLPEEGGRRGPEWLAAGLHLRPGHSGGPMVDAQGRLVGINTMMNGPDVGVAVPVHVAQEFVRRAQAAPVPPGARPQGTVQPVWV